MAYVPYTIPGFALAKSVALARDERLLDAICHASILSVVRTGARAPFQRARTTCEERGAKLRTCYERSITRSSASSPTPMRNVVVPTTPNPSDSYSRIARSFRCQTWR